MEQTKEVVKAFVTLYFTLYSTRAHYTIMELDYYLQDVSLPKSLDSPLSTDEIGNASQSFARKKMPGLDGFPIEMVYAI